MADKEEVQTPEETAQETSEESTPAESTPTETTPAESTPAETTPSEESTPAETTPSEESAPIPEEVEPRKRPADATNDENPKKPKTIDDMVLKMLCPFWCAGAVIGSKGEDIKRMKEETGCSIKVSKNFENFPTTNERVVSLKGKLSELTKLIIEIQTKIRTDKPPANAPVRDNSARKSSLKLVVATSSAGRIIGKGGAQTKQLQEDHKVEIDVMKSRDVPAGLAESVVTIAGSHENVDECVKRIIEIVSEDTKSNLNYGIDYSEYSERREGSNRHNDNYNDRYRGGWGGPQWGQGYPPQPQPWGGFRGGYGGYGGYNSYHGYGRGFGGGYGRW